MVHLPTSLGAVETVPALEMDARNIEVGFEPGRAGAGTLKLRYRGPLAREGQLWIRFGERREGRDWVNPRDVAMTVSKGQATATIACEKGEPIEGACFAFYTHHDGAQGPERWDNAGHSFGYYFYEPRAKTIETR